MKSKTTNGSYWTAGALPVVSKQIKIIRLELPFMIRLDSRL
jgi:hypothetical protein